VLDPPVLVIGLVAKLNHLLIDLLTTCEVELDGRQVQLLTKLKGKISTTFNRKETRGQTKLKPSVLRP